MVENKVYCVHRRYIKDRWCIVFRDGDKDVLIKDASMYSPYFFNKLPGFYCCVDIVVDNKVKDIQVRYPAYVVERSEWNNIPKHYKGVFLDYYGKHPNWKGRKTVFAGCIGGVGTTLLIEGVHFVIV